jgi:hypothetical protein
LHASLPSETRCTTAKIRPDTVAVDENTTVVGDVREEGRLQLCVREADNLYATARRGRELRLEIDNAVEAGIAQYH